MMKVAGGFGRAVRGNGGGVGRFDGEDGINNPEVRVNAFEVLSFVDTIPYFSLFV